MKLLLCECEGSEACTWVFGCGCEVRLIAEDLLLPQQRRILQQGPHTCRKRRLREGADKEARNPHLCILFLRHIMSEK